MGLFSPLQKYYGKEVDKLVRYGNVAVNKGNFLPMLVKARQETYKKENIMSAWRGSGLIPPNSQAVLIKLPTYREKVTSKPVPAPPVPPTPRNSKALLHQARQAKLLLKPGSSLTSDQKEELVDLMDSLE